MQPVLIDIDDTLADTTAVLLEYVNSRAERSYTFDELTRDHREAGVAEYKALVDEFLQRADLFQSVQPFSGALDACQKLHTAGYAIHIASARRENLHDVTTGWLKEHGFIDYVERIHRRSSQHPGRDFKRLVAEEVKPAAVFDDTAEVAETLAGSGILVYLIDQPWNAGEIPANIKRSPSFAAAVEEFLNT